MNSASASTAVVGFEEAKVSGGEASADELVYRSWKSYLRDTLGRSEAFAHQRAMADVNRTRAKSFVEGLKTAGWRLDGMSVLDLGSGHGSLAIELALAGAKVTAAEPCDGWREVAERRSSELGLDIRHVFADGADQPFADREFDAVISLQVLEHVRSPRDVISEISRVLRPGGRFVVSCENYLAFREQHYDVMWFPLLPRWMGALYLRVRGRNPEFLIKHVTFTTWPQLLREFIVNELIADEWVAVLEAKPEKMKWRVWCLYATTKALAGESMARRLLVLAQNRRKIFGIGFCASGVRR